MASTLANGNLYPPIVATSMPSFLRTKSCKVYFSLSAYNDLSDLSTQAQVTVCQQNSSLTALNTDQFPAGVAMCTISTDSSVDGDAKYFVTIEPSWLKDGAFAANTFYKVQIRFQNKDVTFNDAAAIADAFDAAVTIVNGRSSAALASVSTNYYYHLKQSVGLEENDGSWTSGSTLAWYNLLNGYINNLYSTALSYLASPSSWNLSTVQKDLNTEYEAAITKIKNSGHTIDTDWYITTLVNVDSCYADLQTIIESLSYESKLGPSNTWLLANSDYFSEWSTVCLIKGIDAPSIYLQGFDDMTGDTDSAIYTSTIVLDVIGTISFGDDITNESEYLSSYQIKIYDDEGLTYNSGIIYTNEFYPNEFNHTVKKNLENLVSYTLYLYYTTNNGYSSYKKYSFMASSYGISALNCSDPTQEADNENGRIAVSITFESDFLGNLCVRRTSNESDFTIWEDVYIGLEYIDVTDNATFTWYDYSAEPGVFYTYGVQQINSKGQRGTLVYTRSEDNNDVAAVGVMLYTDDIFLVRDGIQLAVKFDPSLSSFKVVKSESSTETLGSQYPYIRRNGNVSYKQFPISGLITAFMDEEHLFTSRNIMFGSYREDYDNYLKEHDITEYNDFITEREFREKVMDFLYDNSAMLYKSLPEGNILIRLMDVSFTPNETLGRMLYSFSATAYEIDECSLANLDSYGIQTIGEYSTDVSASYAILGQVSGTGNIWSQINSKIALTVQDGYAIDVDYLVWARLDFQTPPYLIADNGTLSAVTGSSQTGVLNGYIANLTVGGEDAQIFISPRGVYELADSNTRVTNLSIPNSAEAIVDYLVYVKKYEDASEIASAYYLYKKPGQLWGVFDIDTSIALQISAKYYNKNSTFYQYLTAIDRITVEADPGTVVYVLDSFDAQETSTTYDRHVIGPTGVLDFYDEDSTISAFYFGGVHLEKEVNTGRDEVEDGYYRTLAEVYNSLDEIENPIKNGVYKIYIGDDEEADVVEALNTYSIQDTTATVLETDNVLYSTDTAYGIYLDSVVDNIDRYIYYHGQWYKFFIDSSTIGSGGDVLCPVEGLVDYIYESLKGVY